MAGIYNRLNALENGRIKDLTGADYDGYLATNIVKLREDIDDLFQKMAEGALSDGAKLGKALYPEE